MGVRRFTVLMQDEITQYKKELVFEGDDAIAAIENWRLEAVQGKNDVHSTHTVMEFNKEELALEDCPF